MLHVTCLKDGSSLKRGTGYKSSTGNHGVPGVSSLDFARYGISNVQLEKSLYELWGIKRHTRKCLALF